MSDLFRDDVTAQELFDAVWTHFVVNGAPRSVDEGGEACAYRGVNGAKCAVGLLVADDECVGWEGKGVASLHGHGRLPARLDRHERLLADLQHAHDRQCAHPHAFAFVARQHGLTVPS